VGLTRLELVTFPLSEGCSNRLSYRPIQKKLMALLLSLPSATHYINRVSIGTLTTEKWQESSKAWGLTGTSYDEVIDLGVLAS
jgi:hypothetical protein